MKRRLLVLILLFVLLAIQLTSLFSIFKAEAQSISPPPTPRFKLTLARINEITYKVNITNIGNSSSSIRIDIALPKTWMPDTYVEIKEITLTHGSIGNYSNRENNYIYIIFNSDPHESTQINITFYSLKYKLEYYTHKRVQSMSYPNELTIYTQPEQYIESNDTAVEGLAIGLAGDQKNPFRIAEKIYDFVISQLRYAVQPKIRGALWALLNREGDCTEYGTLFVALMRALGIPARIVTGHMSRALSEGGTTNATNLSVDSPHLWVEFYVEGYGWIPVDPTSGEGNPLRYFGILWSYYLPFLKGPTMEAPYRALLTLKSEHLESVEYSATLIVNLLATFPFQNQAILSIYEANELANTMRRTAYEAYNTSLLGYQASMWQFNITETYPLLQETHDSFYNSTLAFSQSDFLDADIYAKTASQNAKQALELISALTISEARVAVTRAWKELRLLGASSGENYIKRAEECKSNGDYIYMVKYAQYARITADSAPNIVVFIGPILLCVFTVWMITRKGTKKK